MALALGEEVDKESKKFCCVISSFKICYSLSIMNFVLGLEDFDLFFTSKVSINNGAIYTEGILLFILLQSIDSHDKNLYFKDVINISWGYA